MNQMTKCALWTLMIVAGDVNSIAQKQRIIRVPLLPSEEIAVVTFNPKRVSEVDVRRWMLLADNARYSSPDSHSFYSCNASDTATYERRLQSEISKSRQVVSDLNQNTYPPELSQIVMYLKRLQ